MRPFLAGCLFISLSLSCSAFGRAIEALEKPKPWMEVDLRDSMRKPPGTNDEKSGSEEVNREFCRTLKESFSPAKNMIALAYRAESQRNAREVKVTYAKVASEFAKAKSGYELCGFSPDETFKEVELAFFEAKEILARQVP